MHHSLAISDDPFRTASPYDAPGEREPIDEETLRAELRAELDRELSRALQLDHNVVVGRGSHPQRAAEFLYDCADRATEEAFAGLVRALQRGSQHDAIIVSLANRWRALAALRAVDVLVDAALDGRAVSFGPRQ